MLPFLKKQDGAKTKVRSKREEKKGINIRWNSTLFFQLSVLLCLGLAFAIIESDFSLGKRMAYTIHDDTIEEPSSFVFVIDRPEIEVKPKVKPPSRIRPEKVTAAVFEIKDNDSETTEADTAPTDMDPDTDTPDTPIVTTPPVTLPEGPKNINTVQFVPIFPGCESLSNNEERKACMSSKIDKFINRKFNTEKFAYLGADKTHKVNVQFTIGKDGLVKDIRARSSEPGLEQEAKKVMAKMPKIKPGKQGEESVDVIFMVPIKFRVSG